jgi:putative methyltransferase (TIGR04325 family)
MLQSLTPPFLWTIGKNLKRRWFRSVDHYWYAPDAWSTPLPDDARREDDSSANLHDRRMECEALIAQVRAGKPVITDCGVGMKRIAFGYVLAFIARNHRAISILDYGGGLGEDYWVGRALAPDLALDYHCEELRAVAEAGRALNPDVKWHTDNASFQHQYDLVMFSSSLQYLPDWKGTLRLAAAAARRHLFISDTPIVRAVATYAAIERSASVTNVHWLLNRNEVVETLADAGFIAVQEMAMGNYPYVADAPEQPTCAALLFERRAPRRGPTESSA